MQIFRPTFTPLRPMCSHSFWACSSAALAYPVCTDAQCVCAGKTSRGEEEEGVSEIQTAAHDSFR